MNQGHPQPDMYYSPHYSTPQYGYGYSTNGAPTTAVSTPMPAPQNVLPVPSALSNQGAMQQPSYSNSSNNGAFDTTGQHNPPGMKPRVTATLWEDEGSLCFQVEARGICVARREDNHMINGTKLLNVAGMTRGRRDGILKSEKVRHVVKIGPMHLKGVWIPYDRALDFANKEKITELLFPLFVHNIGALLYHPSNSNRTSQVMAAAERRKHEGLGGQRPAAPNALPSIGQHHPMMPGLPTGGYVPQSLANGPQSLASTPQPLTNGSQPPMPNGGGMLKRGREEEEDLHRPVSNGHDPMSNMHAMSNGYPQQPPLANVHQPPMQNGGDMLKRGRDEDDEVHRSAHTAHDTMNNMPGSMPGLSNAYAQPLPNVHHQPLANGDGGMLKRGRDEDDDVHRSSPNGHDSAGNFEVKRRKTITSNDSMVSPGGFYTLHNGYGQPGVMNGMSPYKRRDDEAETPRPGPNVHDHLNNFDLKRHKTMETSVPAPQYDAMNRPHSSIGTSPTYAPAPVYDNLARPASTVAASPSYPSAPVYDTGARPPSAISAPRRQQSFG
ncbi:Cell pattern formation-associated protein STUA [Fusarium oxysporum]|uniref:Cell pattern formation-associated protein STUA n=1 Tax=Fusarium oxysporum TaxID=5507 RepID=A0A420MP59_FUSOX|nr:Cell pattern formation-associated protein STUA [Fusarium oxysporum]